MIPSAYKKKIRLSAPVVRMKTFLKNTGLNTVCESARCPNQSECYSRGVVTFMILGNACTRGCRYCSVPKGRPEEVDPHEPEKISEAIKQSKVKHVVITSVTRDDLKDGGAFHFVNVLNYLKRKNPEVSLEVLIPDFFGSYAGLQKVIDAHPQVLNHNMETVKELYHRVRPKAVYEQSLNILKITKESNEKIITKSGVMLGLGETKNQIEALMEDLIGKKCDFLTLGQYFQPMKKSLPVIKYLEDEEFKEYEEMGYDKGFKLVASGRYVRSSYLADGSFETIKATN